MKQKKDAKENKTASYSIKEQPDNSTCGPTALHSVYRHYGEEISIDDVISQVGQIPGGGTFAPILGTHALNKGYSVKMYTFNMRVFDPSWFDPPYHDDPQYLISKLQQQAKVKRSPRLKIVTEAYINFLKKGGKIFFEDLTSGLLQRYLKSNIPIITGLSSTYLYRSKREHNDKSDDIRGKSAGHFVVLYHYNKETKQVSVADPYSPKEMLRHRHYQVNLSRLVCAILLGVLSYDANLLIIEK
ncbi:MAG: C39 family peptidase [Candidatus Woesearchaeota archaeon]